MVHSKWLWIPQTLAWRLLRWARAFLFRLYGASWRLTRPEADALTIDQLNAHANALPHGDGEKLRKLIIEPRRRAAIRKLYAPLHR